MGIRWNGKHYEWAHLNLEIDVNEFPDLSEYLLMEFDRLITYRENPFHKLSLDQVFQLVKLCNHFKYYAEMDDLLRSYVLSILSSPNLKEDAEKALIA